MLIVVTEPVDFVELVGEINTVSVPAVNLSVSGKQDELNGTEVPPLYFHLTVNLYPDNLDVNGTLFQHRLEIMNPNHSHLYPHIYFVGICKF